MLTEAFVKSLKSAGNRIANAAFEIEDDEIVPSKYLKPAEDAVKPFSSAVLAEVRKDIASQPADVKCSYDLLRAWHLSKAKPAQQMRIVRHFIKAYKKAGRPERWAELSPVLGLLH